MVRANNFYYFFINFKLPLIKIHYFCSQKKTIINFILKIFGYQNHFGHIAIAYDKHILCIPLFAHFYNV